MYPSLPQRVSCRPPAAPQPASPPVSTSRKGSKHSHASERGGDASLPSVRGSARAVADAAIAVPRPAAGAVRAAPVGVGDGAASSADGGADDPAPAAAAVAAGAPRRAAVAASVYLASSSAGAGAWQTVQRVAAGGGLFDEEVDRPACSSRASAAAAVAASCGRSGAVLSSRSIAPAPHSCKQSGQTYASRCGDRRCSSIRAAAREIALSGLRCSDDLSGLRSRDLPSPRPLKKPSMRAKPDGTGGAGVGSTSRGVSRRRRGGGGALPPPSRLAAAASASEVMAAAIKSAPASAAEAACVGHQLRVKRWVRGAGARGSGSGGEGQEGGTPLN